jgi:hypothetical protein
MRRSKPRMGSLSRQKGKRVEREAAAAVADALACEARRSVQFCGRAGDADLTTTIEGVHFEVKARAAHSCFRFYEQAEEDAAGKAIPVVLLREDGERRFLALVDLNHVRDLAVRICRVGEMP